MDAFNELFESFSSSKREKLQELFDNYKLTKAQMLILLKASADLELFLEDDIFKFLDFEKIDKLQGKRRAQEIVKQVEDKLNLIKYTPTDYSTFYPPVIRRKKDNIEVISNDGLKLFGKCPCLVDGE